MKMHTPLALLNLWHQSIKTCVSIGGVAFALLLVFMQLGFMGAVSFTASNLLQQLEFDVLVRARDYVHLYEPGQIDRRNLIIAGNTPGVDKVLPLWITIQNWRTLPNYQQPLVDAFASQYLPIAVMAFPPDQCAFRSKQIQQMRKLLTRDDVVLVDDSTQANYGPWNGRRFTVDDLGRETEVGGQAFSIGGLFSLGTGLAANGALITSDRGFSRISPWDINSTTSLGLVQLANHDAQTQARAVQEIKQRLSLNTGANTSERDMLVGVVDVFTKSEALDREQTRWLWQTPLGLIFQMGVVLSLMVGSAIVYMVLATDVANRLPEYATLLAMGYSRIYLASIVMTQAIVLSVLGFVVAWGIAEVLYSLTSYASGIPLLMNARRVWIVAGLGLMMSCLSGLLALRKLWKAEPASLF